MCSRGHRFILPQVTKTNQNNNTLHFFLIKCKSNQYLQYIFKGIVSPKTIKHLNEC